MLFSLDLLVAVVVPCSEKILWKGIFQNSLGVFQESKELLLHKKVK